LKLLKYIQNSRNNTSGSFFSQLKATLNIRPNNKEVYKKAFTHSSVNLKDDQGNRINFERLEFLGDALLNTVISEYLFELFPFASEGELTKIRAKIVSRDSLNAIGRQMQLMALAETSNNKNFGNNIHGNLLESLLGAIFMDKGYEKAKIYILQKIIAPYVDMESNDKSVLSYKSLLIEWAQKNKQQLHFKTESDEGLDPEINYFSAIYLEQKLITKARNSSKKKAEEKAAQHAYHALKLKSTHE